MRMPTLKIELISMTDGLNLFNTDDGYVVLNHLGYILKSSKTIYPCLKFIRAFMNGLFKNPGLMEDLKSSSLIESDYFEEEE